MKTREQIREFYESELKPQLELFEQQRKAIVKHVLIIAGITGLLLLIGFLFVAQQGGNAVILLVILIIGLIVGGGYVAFAQKDYRSLFKITIIERLIKFIEPDLTYLPGQGINKEQFKVSSLFTHSIDRYHCEDLVQGKVGQTEMIFSEVHAEYKTTSGSGKNRHTEWHTIFKGLFFIADFNKNFHGRTLVLPDTAQKMFGSFGQTLQSWNMSRDQLIRMDDVEFEKEFVVYGTDQIEARYILSPALMERILNFRRKLKDNLYMSFVGSKVFVAVPLEVDLFEPKVFGSSAGFDVICEYCGQLMFAIGIVDELNLNTRIWSKG